MMKNQACSKSAPCYYTITQKLFFFFTDERLCKGLNYYADTIITTTMKVLFHRNLGLTVAGCHLNIRTGREYPQQFS